MRIQFSNGICNHVKVYALAYYNFCYEMKEYYCINEDEDRVESMIDALNEQNSFDEIEKLGDDEMPRVETPPLFKCEPQLSLGDMIWQSLELAGYFDSKPIKYLSALNMEFLNSPFPIEYQQHAFPIESVDQCDNEKRVLVADPTSCRVFMNIMIASLRNLYVENWDFTGLDHDSGNTIRNIAHIYHDYWNFHKKFGSVADEHDIVLNVDSIRAFNKLPVDFRSKAIKSFIYGFSRYKKEKNIEANAHTNYWYTCRFLEHFRSKHNLAE